MKTLHQSGNSSLLFREKTAFLCSRQIPNNKREAIFNWISRLSPEKDCIICGNHSQMEQMVFNELLDQMVPAILVLAEGMKYEWNEKITSALNNKRLLIITTCNENVHRVNHQSAYDRNNLILSLADQIIVGYCTPKRNIDKQIAGRANVTFLDRTQYPTLQQATINIAADCKTINYCSSTKKEENSTSL